MKVIRMSPYNDPWTKQYTCQACLSVLEYDVHDVNVSKGYTSAEYTAYVSCKVCGKYEYVTSLFKQEHLRLIEKGLIPTDSQVDSAIDTEF